MKFISVQFISIPLIPNGCIYILLNQTSAFVLLMYLQGDEIISWPDSLSRLSFFLFSFAIVVKILLKCYYSKHINLKQDI